MRTLTRCDDLVLALYEAEDAEEASGAAEAGDALAAAVRQATGQKKRKRGSVKKDTKVSEGDRNRLVDKV